VPVDFLKLNNIVEKEEDIVVNEIDFLPSVAFEDFLSEL
jgi:hypothetical protein